jgi:F0F1-type ATP synthase membrane subunit b/b'
MSLQQIDSSKGEVESDQPWDGSWEQAVDPENSVDSELSAVRANRTKAEAARQQIADEILKATKDVCQRLIEDGERAPERARYLESEAEGMNEEAQSLLARAEATKAESEVYRDNVVAEARQEAQKLFESVRSDAERESRDLRQRAYQESQKVVSQAEAMRSAAAEELEAQKIYTEAARLKAESHEVLALVSESLQRPANGVVRTSTNGHKPKAQSVDAVKAEGPVQDDPPPAQPATDGPPVTKRSRSRSKPKGSNKAKPA